MSAPLSNKLGWRPDMTVEEVLAHTSLHEVGRRTLPPMGLFTMLHLKKEKRGEGLPEWKVPAGAC
jgi:phosphatidylethanolamine/phosphatidyl-N-methylethanolamine N-methyltransferase